jgi:hypothetical protein
VPHSRQFSTLFLWCPPLHPSPLLLIITIIAWISQGRGLGHVFLRRSNFLLANLTLLSLSSFFSLLFPSCLSPRHSNQSLGNPSSPYFGVSVRASLGFEEARQIVSLCRALCRSLLHLGLAARRRRLPFFFGSYSCRSLPTPKKKERKNLD